MVNWFKTLAVVLCMILQGSQALAQAPMTEAEEKPFYDLLSRTRSATSSSLTVIMAKEITADESCRLAAERTERHRAGDREAFALLQKFRAEGKSTDTLHKSYLSLTKSGDDAAVFETEFCARVAGREEPEQTERQITALISLKQQANLDIARYAADGDALNACARAAARLTYSETIAENYDIMALSYSDADSDDRARAARYKAAFNQATSEQAAAETLKSQTCAKVVFKDPPSKPPLPQSEEDKALSAIMTEYLPVMEGFKVANKAIIAQDFKTACTAVKGARQRSDSAEARVRELILKLSNEGKETQKYQDLLNSFIESRKEIAKLETRVCTQAKNEDRAKEMEAELEQRFQSLQAATNELTAASQSKDLAKACKSSRQGGKDARHIITLMREAMAMEGATTSPELAEAETAIKSMTDLAEQFEVVTARTCPK